MNPRLVAGIDPSLWDLWAQAPCPDGMDPHVWADALKTRVSRARSWPHDTLDRLPHYMAGTTASVLAAAPDTEMDQRAA